MVKGSGGTIGLTGNPGALRQLDSSRVSISRITTEFEEQAIHQQVEAGNTVHHHYEQKPAVQTAFLKEEDIGIHF